MSYYRQNIQHMGEEKQRIMVPKNLIQKLAALPNAKSVTAQINELIINRIAQEDANNEHNRK